MEDQFDFCACTDRHQISCGGKKKLGFWQGGKTGKRGEGLDYFWGKVK